MNDLRTAAQQVLNAYDAHEPLAVVMEELRAALAQQAEPVDTDCHTQGICQRSGYGIPKP